MLSHEVCTVYYTQAWGTLLAVPYLLTRGVLPFVSGDLLQAETLQAAYLWGWVTEAALLAGIVLSAQAQRAFTMLHNTLRDEKCAAADCLPCACPNIPLLAVPSYPPSLVSLALRTQRMITSSPACVFHL